jgi:hypothetical protein
MTDLTRRRLLALSGNAAALGLLGGCESFSQSALLRSPVYDTSAADAASNSAAAIEPPSGSRPAIPALFDDIERRTFDFFWDNGNPANGMVPDRYPSASPASIAAIGMALTAYAIGVDRGFITREQARTRTLATVRFFRNAPQGTQRVGMTGYKGFFYHFLDMKTGHRARRCELSTVDTALLIGGMLHAQAYFDADHPDEAEIRAQVDAIYWRIDWKWAQVRGDFVSMGWKPETGFIPHDWQGYNEAMLVVLLAMGSPTHPVGAEAWTAWTNSYKGAWGRFMGYEHLSFAPLFGHQYSHLWIDFRGIKDAYMRQPGHDIDYFENSRRATLAQQAYCIANPLGFIGYSDTLWGITASDCPSGYCARGAPPNQGDNGTIAPTAVAGSLPFAPEICITTLRSLYHTYKPGPLWSKYGFRDAFNLTSNPDWYGADVLGIDQGPIIIMIENYRTGRVWERFMRNVEIRRGLDLAGFQPNPVAVEGGPGARLGAELLPAAPNPFSDRTTLRYRLGEAARVRLSIYDVSGREVARPVDSDLPAGEHEAEFRGGNLPSGIYYCRLHAGAASTGRWIARMK